MYRFLIRKDHMRENKSLTLCWSWRRLEGKWLTGEEAAATPRLLQVQTGVSSFSCPLSSIQCSAALSPPIFTKITQTRKVNKKVVV